MPESEPNPNHDWKLVECTVYDNNWSSIPIPYSYEIAKAPYKLTGFVKWLTDIANSVHPDYRNSLNVMACIDCDEDNYYYTNFEIRYKRPETFEEHRQRIERSLSVEKSISTRELETLEKLITKYPTAASDMVANLTKGE